MRLVFALPPDDAARLPRLKLLSGLKAGRRRTRAVAIVWHDTADGTLAADGLTLAEQERGWRLERPVPRVRPWPPGMAPELLAQAARLDGFPYPLPAGLHGVARFDGQLTTLPLAQDGHHVTMDLLGGSAGWARRRRPACRLTLEGDPTATLALALGLAGELDLMLPPLPLPIEAHAIATGTTPAPADPPEPHAALSVSEAFILTLGRHAAAIQREAAAILAGTPDPEPVHQARVAVRRLRSTLAVFRPAIACPLADAADQGLKTLADCLAPARDLDVFVSETATAVATALPDDPGLPRLRGAVDRRRRAAYATLKAWLRGADHRRLMVMLAALADGSAWDSPTNPAQIEALALPLDSFAAQALKRRLRRLTAAGNSIAGHDPATLHAIRLRAKRLRYAAEIFAPLFPRKATHRFLRRLATLQDRLGTLNDSSVANTLLANLGAITGPHAHASGLIRGYLTACASTARDHIDRAWQRFHRLDPFWA